MRRKTSGALFVGAALALALAGCSGSGDGGGSGGGGSALPAVPDVAMQKTLGQTEGQLNLIAWAGYAEDGSNDKSVDWVTPFTESTGCKVNVKIGATSDEMVTLMKTGEYDGVSASGDATLRLVYGGDVAPVNTALVPNYATISSFLKDQDWNSVGGRMFGIPHGWGANVLMSRKDVVKPAPDSWSAVFDPNSPYKGKITAYDSPIYIADAALYLKATKPELKITDPYELDDAQFTAAVDLLKQQHGLISEYWGDYSKEVSAFNSGNSVIGTAWQINANLINSGNKAKVDTVVPKEGATGWSDTWMVSATSKHPNCMYKWMDWITSPDVNAQVAEWFGEAPAQTLACAKTTDTSFCDTFHALDSGYAGKIAYWKTPTRSCGDSRANTCKDYTAWSSAWTAIKG
jgi:putative spermidine/putrescine transport system substrate-binding protein